MNDKNFIKGCKFCVVISWISCVLSGFSTVLSLTLLAMLDSVSAFISIIGGTVGIILNWWMAKSVSTAVKYINANEKDGNREEGEV